MASKVSRFRILTSRQWRLLCRFAPAVAACLIIGLGSTVRSQPAQPPAPPAAGERVPAVAVVVGASGDTVLLRQSSLISPVRDGAHLYSGDRVTTRAGGRIELRFSDGSVVALQPETEFRVDDYRFDTAGQRNFMTLVRGALRTVSGAIGKRAREDYRLSTPSATIGIRGTEYEATETVCPPRGCEAGARAGLLVKVIQGRVAVANPAGTVEVPAGSSVQVTGRGAAPTLLRGLPITPMSPLPAPSASPRLPAASGALPAAASPAASIPASLPASPAALRAEPAPAAPPVSVSTPVLLPFTEAPFLHAPASGASPVAVNPAGAAASRAAPAEPGERFDASAPITPRLPPY
jgi:hypothetical protein